MKFCLLSVGSNVTELGVIEIAGGGQTYQPKQRIPPAAIIKTKVNITRRVVGEDAFLSDKRQNGFTRKVKMNNKKTY
jgi:hypothetical protein